MQPKPWPYWSALSAALFRVRLPQLLPINLRKQHLSQLLALVRAGLSGAATGDAAGTELSHSIEKILVQSRGMPLSELLILLRPKRHYLAVLLTLRFIISV